MSLFSKFLDAQDQSSLDCSQLEIGRVRVSEVFDELVSEKSFHGLNLKIT